MTSIELFYSGSVQDGCTRHLHVDTLGPIGAVEGRLKAGLSHEHSCVDQSIMTLDSLTYDTHAFDRNRPCN